MYSFNGSPNKLCHNWLIKIKFLLVLLTLWTHYWAVFTFPPFVTFPPFATRMPHICTKNKNSEGPHSHLAETLTYRQSLFIKSHVFLCLASDFRSQTFKALTIAKVHHSFPVPFFFFLQSSTDAFIQILILCTSAMPYCTGMWSTTWVQLYFDNMIGTLLCFCQGHVEWSASHRSWENSPVQLKKGSWKQFGQKPIAWPKWIVIFLNFFLFIHVYR